jgi:glutamine phosphoribosylpyrophosphate amidotransferase
MCEIYLTKGRFTKTFLEKLRVDGENGRGFALIYHNSIAVVKGIEPKRVSEEYLSHSLRAHPIASVLHVRVPTHGSVSIKNTQPFASERRVLAHNGMLSEAYHVLSTVFPKHARQGASDSLLLWYLIRNLPTEHAVSLLRNLDGRFLFADLKWGKIALVGSWRFNCELEVWDRGNLWNESYGYVVLQLPSLKIVHQEPLFQEIRYRGRLIKLREY